MGSSHELYTQLLVAHHKKYFSTEILQKMYNKIEEWQKMASGFQNGLDN